MDSRAPGCRHPHADCNRCQKHRHVHDDCFVFHNGDSRIAPQHLVYAVNRFGAIARFGTGDDTLELPEVTVFNFMVLLRACAGLLSRPLRAVYSRLP
jgi:hypothetical protein